MSENIHAMSRDDLISHAKVLQSAVDNLARENLKLKMSLRTKPQLEHILDASKEGMTMTDIYLGCKVYRTDQYNHGDMFLMCVTHERDLSPCGIVIHMVYGEITQISLNQHVDAFGSFNHTIISLDDFESILSRKNIDEIRTKWFVEDYGDKVLLKNRLDGLLKPAER